MGSALETIQANVVNFVQSIEGMAANSVEAVPITEQFREGSKDDQWIAKMPPSFPGSTISLNDDEIRIVDSLHNMSCAWIEYEVPIYIATFVCTDGQVIGQAQLKAWEIGEIQQRKLMFYVPIPTATQGITARPLKPEGIQPIIVDANTYGLLQKFSAVFRIAG
jgi:hypothetical protein